MNAGTKQWESELLDFLGIDETLFPTLVEPGTILGDLQTAAFPDYDLPNATLITIASHDTASAILGTPGIGDDWAYISSGTWSLLALKRLLQQFLLKLSKKITRMNGAPRTQFVS